MKTDDLIDMLAAGAPAVDSDALRQRYVTAMGWGAFGTLLLMAIWLGVRRDIATASLLPMFWVKLAFPSTLLAGALVLALRLARPGMRLGRVPLLMSVPVLAMWWLAAVVLSSAVAASRNQLIFGVSWTVCPFYIAALSIPAFAAAFWAMREQAPTRPILAGAASGLLAGATGALAYALYCPEMSAPFIGLWYLAGMMIPTVVGAVAGRLLLRW